MVNLDEYKGLPKTHETGYTVSDGYDCAQTAISFLYQCIGRNVHDIYGKDKKDVELTIKRAWYHEIDSFIESLRNRPDRHKQVEYIEFTDYEVLPMDPINCFEKEQAEFGKADALMEAMHLKDKEKEMVEYSMSGWKRSEIAKMLCVTKLCMDYLKFRIRYKYRTYIGQYWYAV